MATPSREVPGETDGATDHAPSHRTPAWVRTFQIAGVVLLLLFIVLHLTGLAPRHGLARSGANPPSPMDAGPRPS